MRKMVLHVCCAPCAGSCVERLLQQGQVTGLYFSNSNLDTPEEFNRRLESVRRLAERFSVPLTVDPYDHEAWLKAVAGLENEPEHGKRCSCCFAFSLGRTAEFAAEKGEPFCTSLTVSPHKNSEQIFAEGRLFPGFAEEDFKKKNGYVRSCEIAREEGFYRQKYCGCEFSRNGGKQ